MRRLVILLLPFLAGAGALLLLRSCGGKQGDCPPVREEKKVRPPTPEEYAASVTVPSNGWLSVRLLAVPNVQLLPEGTVPTGITGTVPSIYKPMIRKISSDSALLCGFEDSDEPAENLEGVRWLEVADGVRMIPDGAFAGLAQLESVQFSGAVRFIGRRAFADSPRLSCVILPEATSTVVASDAFDGCSPNLTCFYPFSPTFTAADGPIAFGGLLWSRVVFCGGPCRGRRLFVAGDFLWSDVAGGAEVIKYIGRERVVPSVPAAMGTVPVVSVRSDLSLRN